MPHFFTIALDHRLQLYDFLRRRLSLDEAIQTINNRQQSENQINTDIHNSSMVTHFNGEFLRIVDNPAWHFPSSGNPGSSKIDRNEPLLALPVVTTREHSGYRPRTWPYSYKNHHGSATTGETENRIWWSGPKSSGDST